MTKISISSNGYALAGNLFEAEGSQNLAFLFIQGWRGSQNIQGAQKLADMGFTCLTYDMRGNGESEGKIEEFSRADFLSDARNVYDYFTQQLPQGTRIAVVGSSFGSYTALLLSTEREMHSLALRVPANYPDEGFDEPHDPQVGSPEIMTWRKEARDYSDNRALKALHDFPGNILIVEAEEDELVPHQTVQNYANAVADGSRLRHVVMRGAPHSLVTSELQAEYDDILTDWAATVVSKQV